MLQINISESELRVGEFGLLTVQSTSPVTLKIKCFVQPPRPPKLKSCDQCGTFRLSNEDTFRFSGDLRVFGSTGGFLQLNLTNEEGEITKKKVLINPSQYEQQ